jgi:GT2 family glycosyltransferase
VTDLLPVSVVIATVGRPALLRACLDSLAACRPRAAEILVVDQSGTDETSNVVERFADVSARVLRLDVRNKSLALNIALQEARNEIVLMTDDDCTVSTAWVQAAWTHLAEDSRAIVTGRVLPFGDPLAVPSTIDDEKSRDYTGELHYGSLWGNNMGCNRSQVLALGGFDERFTAAEDNDLCYRWLRAGQRLRYEPDVVVWHHAWRTHSELDRQYFLYGHGQGIFFAKHLGQGDLAVTRFLAWDLYRGARGIVARVVRRRRQWSDPRSGLLRGLALGFVDGWHAVGPEGSRRDGMSRHRGREGAA